MGKFNIGDRVICLQPNVSCPELVGQQGIISRIMLGNKYPYHVVFDGDCEGYRIWCKVTHLTPLMEALA